jgi:hypothetical protein
MLCQSTQIAKILPPMASEATNNGAKRYGKGDCQGWCHPGWSLSGVHGESPTEELAVGKCLTVFHQRQVDAANSITPSRNRIDIAKVCSGNLFILFLNDLEPDG